MAAYTPMIQQYLKIKAEYQDAFLFFRLGDFYEMFFEDALRAAQELEITLTSREGGTEERIPMCGVPYHSAPTYIERLIEKGYKVAICEQTEDPTQAKGIVRREVIQLITPGTVMEGRSLHEKENNYLATVTHFSDGTYGFAYADLSTGESRVTLLPAKEEEVLNEISVLGAKEVVISADLDEGLQKKMRDRNVLAISYEEQTGLDEAYSTLTEDLNQDKFKVTVARLFNYLHRTQKRSLTHLQPVTTYQVHQYMKIDYYSKHNLELTETIRSKGKKGSLLWLLDETKTAMGGRLLKQWVDRPRIDREEIERRLSVTGQFMNAYFERKELQEGLKEVYDLERLAGRIAFGNVNARDLRQLLRSLQQIPYLHEILSRTQGEETIDLARKLDYCEEIVDLLEQSIVDNPPISIKEGNIIRDGFNEQLDQYRDASRNGKSWIAQLEREERDRTGIRSLKIGYNRVFGYYIEITRANLHLLKEGQYERKQTLANAERFITPELKEKEALILEAEEKCGELEYELFSEIRDRIKEQIPRLQALAKVVSEMDVLQSFAEVSEERKYVKPEFSDNREILIEEGRHPVVEKVLDSQEYVPNSCKMNGDREILLITGPNMSGKSTYMRQVALTAILAQIGCYVPATKAVLPVFDQVFTRIGAADDLVSGQSTFMVEMLEAKNAIANATQDSLILFDEIGRGTSTYDGMALAQAIIEHVHNWIGSKTLFSTHYHELTVLEDELDRLHNVHVSAIEHQGKVVFLHKIKEGPADKSYGIHVAELAGLPKELIIRANEILTSLEQAKIEEPVPAMPDGTSEVNEAVAPSSGTAQLSFFAEPVKAKKQEFSGKEKNVIEKIRELDILDLTPLQAINVLYELQKKIKN
ncbi:DNA mismatch repair protein MutS [Neobacillus notoginsengisoli]|uniref:DNA mismatch repair protein MutS n=1 Tax=Neobacillus notoginsengisoli TaxID=1578198 RepID=A0A417YQN5_9BACI|nr:DNA mismatch repair protein MutS [Neobacillus notoginsengisoli]RHW36355.1 DNA mismatch repair protein MutS [Neobacillus notoginsengisoli]